MVPLYCILIPPWHPSATDTCFLWAQARDYKLYKYKDVAVHVLVNMCTSDNKINLRK